MGIELEVHYPESLPVAAAKYLISAITGGTLLDNLPLACEAAWNVAGYALRVSVGHPDPLIGDTLPTELSADDVAAHLTAAVVAAEAGPGVVGAAAIPWGLVAQFLLKLLLEAL